ncbi:P-loop containing nucleoside triphosphate hydrolase [Phytophthora cactorum]|nr:P-loop containing nucleoside triphosphate hydrolase [Phytophthora cactorum]
MSANPQHVVDTEDAAELNLGDDFRNETCLSNAEVAVILEKQKSDYETQEKQLTNVFQKTYSYVQRFSGTKDPVANQASVTELREALMSLAFQREADGDTVEYRLEEFEIACLSNLNPEEVEEAVALIPSLHKRFAEDEIEEILGIVSQPPTASTAIEDHQHIAISTYEASTTQETSWLRQERGIAVEGEDPIPPPTRSFSEISLSSDAISVLQSRGVTTPSAIQAQALPCVFQGRDVVALAPTGSGKTLCYILPMVELLLRLLSEAAPHFPTVHMMPASPCALAMVPTRELVDQVVQDLAAFFHNSTNPPVVGICGGVAVDDQLAELRQHANSPIAIVATPGRLLHLVQRHGATLSLGQISLLVVDEVDRVDGNAATRGSTAYKRCRSTDIVAVCYASRLLPRLARSAVLRPVTIRVDEANMATQAPFALSNQASPVTMLALSTTSNVVHDVQFIRPAEKPSRLLRVLRATKQPPVLVFCNSRSSVERVARLLRNEQFHVAPLHGGQSQGYRTRALRAFRAGYVDVLVATDLASRGLDLPGVEHVVLFDMPHTIEDYVHRCGRTGRHPGGDFGASGVSGKATSFLTRECAIAMELKQVLRAARQPLPRELEVPRIFHHPSKDAAELNLGDDFENDTCLSNAEVAIILDKQKVNYIEQKTQSYVTRFTGTKDPVANQAAVIELREYVDSRSKTISMGVLSVMCKRQTYTCSALQ